MNLRERIRDWSQPIYYLGQNSVTLTGAVITTSTALTTIAFWFYDVFLPGPPHPYIGILVYLILPAIFVLGSGADSTWYLAPSTQREATAGFSRPSIFACPSCAEPLEYVALATVLNLLIIGTASYRGVQYMGY